jgi:cytochrome d ubiquinol oxidase subunit II
MAFDLCFVAVFAAVTLYAILGGADFGAGIWDAVTRGRLPPEERALLYRAVGPVWEANHVWLVFAIVLTMTAFPLALAETSRLLWVPLLLALTGIVFRGASFVFRAYGPDVAAYERRWSVAFGIASTATPLCFGAAAGAIASGHLEHTLLKEVSPGQTLHLLRPFPIVCALLAVAVCAYLAAVYLTRESAALGSEPLVRAWRRRALVSGVLAGALSIAGIVAMDMDDAAIRDRFHWPFAAVSATAALASFGALWFGRHTTAAASAAVAVGAVTLGWGASQYPYLVFGTDSAAPASVQSALLWATAAGTIVLVPSLWLLFRIFKSARPR